MFKDYIVLYMDSKYELEDCDRNAFEFIINYKDKNDFDEKIKEIFNSNKLSWNKNKEGYKNIFSVRQISLTNVAEY